MPWAAELPQIDFGLPLLDNLITIAKRDQVGALAWVAARPPAVASLKPFAKILKCERVATDFPALAIYPVDDEPEAGDSDVSFNLEVKFGFDVEVTGEKPEALTEELRKRVAAVRMMFLSASMEDLMLHVEGTTGLILKFGRAQFGQVQQVVNKNGLYFRSALSTITFKYLQVGG
jgi:hypothetical protein